MAGGVPHRRGCALAHSSHEEAAEAVLDGRLPRAARAGLLGGGQQSLPRLRARALVRHREVAQDSAIRGGADGARVARSAGGAVGAALIPRPRPQLAGVRPRARKDEADGADALLPLHRLTRHSPRRGGRRWAARGRVAGGARAVRARRAEAGAARSGRRRGARARQASRVGRVRPVRLAASPADRAADAAADGAALPDHLDRQGGGRDHGAAVAADRGAARVGGEERPRLAPHRLQAGAAQPAAQQGRRRRLVRGARVARWLRLRPGRRQPAPAVGGPGEAHGRGSGAAAGGDRQEPGGRAPKGACTARGHRAAQGGAGAGGHGGGQREEPAQGAAPARRGGGGEGAAAGRRGAARRGARDTYARGGRGGGAAEAGRADGRAAQDDEGGQEEGVGRGRRQGGDGCGQAGREGPQRADARAEDAADGRAAGIREASRVDGQAARPPRARAA
mmetsp:Transcript_42629/g.134488  ORF Transcript_42629/g.134488 Transcript_42629/m.134488 type:complete len:451 (+) Transcript_42629:874-2226(+)